MQSFTDSSDIKNDYRALRKRIKKHGYLFLPNLLPTEDVGRVGRQFAEIVRAAGWTLYDTSIGDRIADHQMACVDPEPKYIEVFKRFYQLEMTHALKRHPKLIVFFQKLLGGEVLTHPLHVIRNVFPNKAEYTTRAHQDYVHIQGTVETYTAWIPFHDCPKKMGGLAVADGSHLDGVKDFTVSNGAGGLETIDPHQDKWRTGDFKIGDVLIFHSMIVHKGLANHSQSIRQSMDPRYQRAEDPISEVSMQPYAGCGTWEEIYSSWSKNETKYYWRSQNPRIVPFDWQYYDKRDQIAFDMAYAGNNEAKSALMRIIQRDPNPEKVIKAKTALANLD